MSTSPFNPLNLTIRPAPSGDCWFVCNPDGRILARHSTELQCRQDVAGITWAILAIEREALMSIERGHGTPQLTAHLRHTEADD